MQQPADVMLSVKLTITMLPANVQEDFLGIHILFVKRVRLFFVIIGNYVTRFSYCIKIWHMHLYRLATIGEDPSPDNTSTQEATPYNGASRANNAHARIGMQW